MKNKKKRISNRILLFWFLLFVLVLVVIAVIVRVSLLISGSIYDDQHQFILEIQFPKSEKIVVFNPDSSSINELVINGQLQGEITSLLDIPIDATIHQGDEKKTTPSDLLHEVIHCNIYVCEGINAVDALKLYLFTRAIRPSQITHLTLTLPISNPAATKLIPTLFVDETIYREGLSIEITNASGETGIGNKLANMITHIGGNVISVTAADKIEERTSIITKDTQDQYTIKRFEKILGLHQIISKRPELSDIMIVIGKNHSEF